MVATIWAALAVDAGWGAIEATLRRRRQGIGTDASRSGARSGSLPARASLVVTTLVGAVLLAMVLLPVPARFPSIDRSHDTGARAWLDGHLQGPGTERRDR